MNIKEKPFFTQHHLKNEAQTYSFSYNFVEIANAGRRAPCFCKVEARLPRCEKRLVLNANRRLTNG